MVQKAENSVLRASPIRSRLRPRTIEELSFHMRNTLNEEEPKDKFEGVDKEGIKAAVQELCMDCSVMPWAS